MPNPLALLGHSKPSPAPPPRPTDHKFVSATISRIVGTDVYVSVQEFGSVYDFGPVEVPGGWTPILGEACGVAFDQRNVGYVVWHP